MKIAIVTIGLAICLLAFTANVNAKSIKVISKESHLKDNDVISLLEKEDILKESHEKHSHEHKHDMDDQSKSSEESHEKHSHEHKHDMDDHRKSSEESHEKHSHEHKHDMDDHSKSSEESHEKHSHEHKHDMDDHRKSSEESHEKHSHEHKHDSNESSSSESSSSESSSSESESSEESSGDHSESSEENNGHHSESSEESNESKESSTQTPEDSESTQAPEDSESTQAPEDPQPTEAPEENPESTPAATETPVETETPNESETTSAPEDAETTIIPETREAQVVTIEELHRSIKDLMLLVENMMMSAIDEANAAVEKITNDDMKLYAAHFISMIEENMINIIDKLSESMVIRHPQRHHLPRLPLKPGNDIIEWEADKQPEVQQQSTEDLHKFIKDFMATVEDLVFSNIDEINKLSETVAVEEIKLFVIKFISMIEREMIALVDRVSETRVDFEMPPSHVQEHHHHQHHHHPSSPPNEGEGENQAEEEEMNSVLIQARTFNTLWWQLKSILKTVDGVDCTIEAVVNVKESTYKMLDDFHACGTEVNKPIHALLASAQQVLRISNEIMQIKDHVCDTPDYMAEFGASTPRTITTTTTPTPTQKVSSKCAKKLSTKIRNLNKQISITGKLIEKALMSMCTTTAFEIYHESIVDFPNFIKACAKL